MPTERYVIIEVAENEWMVTYQVPKEGVIAQHNTSLEVLESSKLAIEYVRQHALANQRDINTRRYEERLPSDTEIEIPVVNA